MKNRFNKIPILIIVIFAVLYCLPPFDYKKYFYLNTTSSMPIGLYKVVNQNPKIGSIVLVDKPNKFTNALLVKPIIAISGDYVCVKNGKVAINAKNFLAIKNDIGIKMCRNLSQHEFYVGVKNKINSIDSRYLGVIKTQHIKNILIPVITFS